jgi:hypothetical protein
MAARGSAGSPEFERTARLSGPLAGHETVELQTKLREIEARMENPRFASVRNANRRFHRAITRHLSLRRRRVEAEALARRRATMTARRSHNAALYAPLNRRPVHGPYHKGRGPQEFGSVGPYWERDPRMKYPKSGRKTRRSSRF